MQRVHLQHLERGTNFYTIRADKVIVTDVLYTASDIEDRLRGV